jgi:hypothetical protein
MRLDIRIPIGGMFALLGLILTLYGAFTSGDPMYARSLDVNINLWWGGVMLIFGVVMLVMGMKKKAT